MYIGVVLTSRMHTSTYLLVLIDSIGADNYVRRAHKYGQQHNNNGLPAYMSKRACIL